LKSIERGFIVLSVVPAFIPSLDSAHTEAQAVLKRGRGRPRLTPEEREARAAVAAEKPMERKQLLFTLKNCLLALFGFALGGFVPLASYTLIHQEVSKRPALWALVAGGLVYSAVSVYTWGVTFFQYRLKAAGFVVLLEGTLTFCSIRWLCLSGLSILIVLNGISAAINRLNRNQNNQEFHN
jgi:hypothetical protein